MKFVVILVISLVAYIDATKSRIIGGEDAIAGSNFVARIVSIKENSNAGSLFSGVVVTPTRVVTVGQAVFE